MQVLTSAVVPRVLRPVSVPARCRAGSHLTLRAGSYLLQRFTRPVPSVITAAAAVLSQATKHGCLAVRCSTAAARLPHDTPCAAEQVDLPWRNIYCSHVARKAAAGDVCCGQQQLELAAAASASHDWCTNALSTLFTHLLLSQPRLLMCAVSVWYLPYCVIA